RLVEGEGPRAAAAAQVVGALVADGADEAQRGVAAVRMELGRLAAMRAGHAGPVVSVFFPASRRSRALAAVRWARARILNSLAPKRSASSVVASSEASAFSSASTASWMARARSSTSACLSGGEGAEGMGDSSSGLGFSSTRPANPLMYKDSTNFQDAHRLV